MLAVYEKENVKTVFARLTNGSGVMLLFCG